MDIEKLKRKKQLNVQEQNYILEHRILTEATYWRRNRLPKGLSDVIMEKGINEEKCIILDYEQNFPGCSSDYGIILTEEGKFIGFEMDLSENKGKLIELYLWSDKTDSIEICKSANGTGASWGYLALKVFRLLNTQ